MLRTLSRRLLSASRPHAQRVPVAACHRLRLFSSAPVSSSSASGSGSGSGSGSVNNKESTYITGLEVVTNAHEVLSSLYRHTLQKLEVIPADAMYRQSVASFTQFRLGVLDRHTDVAKIEKEIGDGQIEELIATAKNELEVMDMMIESKPWLSDPELVEIGYVAPDFENLEDPALSAKNNEARKARIAKKVAAGETTEEEAEMAYWTPFQ